MPGYTNGNLDYALFPGAAFERVTAATLSPPLIEEKLFMLKQLLLVGLSFCAITGAGAEEIPGSDIYRISDAVFDSHVEYHKFDIPKGGEVPLADL